MKNNNLKIINKKGFSFGEVMLSVLVLGVGLVGTISLINSNIRNSTDTRDSIIASELAQEGVELVRNIRDNNWIATPIRPTFDGDYLPAAAASNCRVDKDNPASNNLKVICGQSYVLNTDANGFYTHSVGSATKFQRKIFFFVSGSNRIVVNYVIWGTAFPADPVDLGHIGDGCTISAKCTYTMLTLSEWGKK
jgi:Tfp pilus assembly protein PilV